MDFGRVPLQYVSTTMEEMQNYFDHHIAPFCSKSITFNHLNKIGESRFGEVFRGKYNCDNGQEIAMKKILLRDRSDQSFPISAFKEIQTLQQLKHDNVIELLELCFIRADITFYLIHELCEHDLRGLLFNSDVKFNFGEIKQVIQQLLVGLQYIHGRKIIHRDIKPSNILFTKTGILKISDFSLSRGENVPDDGLLNYTDKVVSLWYRSPELLLGEWNYGTHVDIWGVGCIMAEMWTHNPIMKGDSEQQQLVKIIDVCGSITPEVWPKVVDLHFFNILSLPRGMKRKTIEFLKPYVHDSFTWDLFDCLLWLDPGKRINATSALNHDFFKTYPLPQSLSKIFSELHGSIRHHEYSISRRQNANGRE